MRFRILAIQSSSGLFLFVVFTIAAIDGVWLEAQARFNDRMDIHRYTSKIEAQKTRLLSFRDGNLANDFLDHMRGRGLSEGRVFSYACRMTALLAFLQRADASTITLRGCTSSPP